MRYDRCCVMFFFSSRRRHTRCSRDWSSDVCSSDLIRLNQARFEAGEMHIKRGLEMRKRGELDGAVLEFQKALAADPSSSIADQELNRTAEIIAEKNQDRKSVV